MESQAGADLVTKSKTIYCDRAWLRLALMAGIWKGMGTPMTGSLLMQYLQVNALIARELSGFTCTSSLTMNEKFQYRTRRPRAVLKNFEFIVSERVQVNPEQWVR